MGPFAKISRPSMREFLQNVGYYDIADAKRIGNANSERYCFWLLKITATYYLTPEYVVIQGSSELVQRSPRALKQIIGRSDANSQQAPYSHQPNRNRPLLDNPICPSNVKSFPLNVRKTSLANIARQNRYINERIAQIELITPGMCDRSSQTDPLTEFINSDNNI